MAMMSDKEIWLRKGLHGCYTFIYGQVIRVYLEGRINAVSGMRERTVRWTAA